MSEQQPQQNNCIKDSKAGEWIIDNGKEHKWMIVHNEIIDYILCTRCGTKKAKV